MRKDEEMASPDSCLNKAHPDELIFVLLARDDAAPAAVRAWIDERIRLGKNRPDDPKIVDARRWIDDVLDGQATDAYRSGRHDGTAPGRS